MAKIVCAKGIIPEPVAMFSFYEQKLQIFAKIFARARAGPELRGVPFREKSFSKPRQKFFFARRARAKREKGAPVSSGAKKII